MMVRMLMLAVALLSMAVSSKLTAQASGDIVELRQAPSALDPSKGYILFRSSRAKTGLLTIEHIFLRIPTATEVEAWSSARQVAYDAELPRLRERARDGDVTPIEEFGFDYNGPTNLFSSHIGQYLIDGREMRTLLLEVPAGEYVLYGVSVAGRVLVTCNCLGTVGFEVKPGVITDIGSLYADKVHNDSPLPYLEDNLGPSMFEYGWIMGQALVPATDSTTLPDLLRNFMVERPEFRAVGTFHDPFAPSINRLAPIPGVLEYRDGVVVDVRTGTVARNVN